MSSVETLVGEYVQFLSVEKGRARATLVSYQHDIDAFVRWCDETGRMVTSLSTADLEAYLSNLRATRAPSTVARSASTLRGWFRFLHDEGRLGSNPATLVRPAKRGRTLPKPLPEETIVDLLDGISGTAAIDRRDRALLEFLYGTGARVSEVAGMRLGDLDFDEETLRLVGKGNKQRLVPMGSTLRVTLTEYLRYARPQLVGSARHDVVFLNRRGGALSRQGIDLIIDKRALDAGIARSSISAHVFRHSCATHMLAHGADIRVVQELLGHASIATTQLYTAVSITSLQREYRSAHPRAID